MTAFRDEAAVTARALGIWNSVLASTTDRQRGRSAPDPWRGLQPTVFLPQTRPGVNGPSAHPPARKPVLVVPVDLSPRSFTVARLGVEMARKAQGVLVLVHAVHLNLTPRGPANWARLRAALGQEAVVKVEPILASAQQAGVTAMFTVEEGAPAKVIGLVSRRWQASVIILASQKRGALARWFRPAIADKVVREAHCPVVVLQSWAQ